MKYDEQLVIEPLKVITTINDFIKPFLEKRGTEGIVLLYKKCIECTVNVEIARSIIGTKNIRLIVTKGRFMDRQPRESMDINQISKSVNLPKKNIIILNKDRILREIQSSFSESHRLGSSISTDFLPVINYNLSYFLLRNMISAEVEEKTYKTPTKKPVSSREKFFQRSIANYKTQVRLGMLLGFLVAESENKVVFSNISKTEWLLGLFTKFGSYHAADFLPLADLYYTQIYQLAKHFRVEAQFKDDRPEKPSSYQFFFEHSSEDIDRVLIRLEDGVSPERIVETTGIPQIAVEKIKNHYESSIYARSVPKIPKLS